MSQYSLSLPFSPLFSADNFFISASNKEAWNWIQAWPNWPSHALILYGPEGSGKSHLGAIWARRAKAHQITDAGDQMPNENGVIENIETWQNERALLHFFNATRENKNSLLLTSSVAPTQLPFSLPDLRSRLLAIPSVKLNPPDDETLAGVMRKQFSDRQMKVEDEVITYIIPRMERSLGKVKELVELLDKKALAERKNITIPFVKKLL